MFRSTIYDTLRVCLALVPWALLVLITQPNATTVAAGALVTLAAPSFQIERRRPAFALGVEADRLRITLSILSPVGVILLGMKSCDLLG